MRLRLGWLWLSLCCLLQWPAGIAAQSCGGSWQQALNDKKACITVHYYEGEPFMYRDAQGRLTGIEYELLIAFANYVATKYGVQLEYDFVHNPDFADLLNKVSQAKDAGTMGASAMAITDERLRILNFTPRYMPDLSVLATHYSLPTLKESEFIAMQDSIVAYYIPRTTGERMFQALKRERMPRMRMQPVQSLRELFAAMGAGRYNVSYLNLPFYFSAKQKGYQFRRQSVFPIKHIGYGFGMPKHSDWQAPLNEFFGSLVFRALTNRILTKNLGSDINELLNEISPQDSLRAEQEIMLLNKERSLQESQLLEQELRILQQERQVYWAALGAVLALGFAAFYFINARVRKRNNQMLQLQNQRIEHQKEELQSINEQLNDTLANLQSTQNQLVLSEKMASLGRLVSNVAHDINTPIGAIRASASTLEEYVAYFVHELPVFVGTLNTSERVLLDHLLDWGSGLAITHLSTREERLYRRQIEQLLAITGADPAIDADSLLRAGIIDLSPLQAYWQEPRLAELLRHAGQIKGFRESVANIQQSVEKARTVVTGLKLMHQEGRQSLLQPIDLAASLEAALVFYRSSFQQGLGLVLDLQPGIAVPANAEELKQVWLHLIENALHAMKGQGKLTIQLVGQANNARVSINDDGPGIPAHQLPHVFEPFYTTKEGGEGSGLGLYVTKKIIENIGGQISITSQPGATTVTILLPLR